MTAEDRRERERSARHRLIMTTARTVATREGWDAVTTRRLSTEIEYSQPVIYKHFASMDDLVEAVALEGFGELAEGLGAARRLAETPGDEVGRVAAAYSRFAADNPALYDAMFTRATRLHFGTENPPAPMAQAFTELRAAAAGVALTQDVDTLTEVLWAALHGLALLGRTDRLRPGRDAERTEALIDRFRPAGVVHEAAGGSPSGSMTN